MPVYHNCIIQVVWLYLHNTIAVFSVLTPVYTCVHLCIIPVIVSPRWCGYTCTVAVFIHTCVL